MKICFLIGGFAGNGGIGRVTSILANGLVKKTDVDIHALIYSKSVAPDLYDLDSKIKKAYLFNELVTMKRAFLKNIIGKVRKYLKENHIDVIIACGTMFYPVAVMAAKGLKTKSICWEHTGPYVKTDHFLQMESRKYGAKHSDTNVLLTQATQSIYSKEFRKDPSKNVIIHNPVDLSVLRENTGYDTESKRIISVGRLSYPKNFELLVRVAEKVLKKYPEWSWDIYGKGEMKEKLQKQIDEAGIAERLILRGQVKNLYEKYKESAFVVMTSRYEGFPMVLLEASASALPMVSFDIETGPNEIIVDGKNGFLLPPEDEEAMRKAIQKMIENPDMRREMSSHSYEASKNFELNLILDQWVSLFDSLL